MSAKMSKDVAEITEVARNYMERCDQLEAENAALRQQVERLAEACYQAWDTPTPQSHKGENRIGSLPTLCLA